jgi:hypothetical protein
MLMIISTREVFSSSVHYMNYLYTIFAIPHTELLKQVVNN